MAEDSKLLGVFGVMDGHGGDFCSSFVASFLPSAIEEAFALIDDDHRITFKEKVEEALIKAFAATETSLKQQPRMRVDVEKIVKDTGIKWKVTPVIDKVQEK